MALGDLLHLQLRGELSADAAADASPIPIAVTPADPPADGSTDAPSIIDADGATYHNTSADDTATIEGTHSCSDLLPDIQTHSDTISKAN